MSTLSPVVQIHLERPLPPEAFLDRVYDELYRAEKELNSGRLAGLLVAGKLTWDQLKQYAIALLQFDDKPAMQPGGKPVSVVS